MRAIATTLTQISFNRGSAWKGRIMNAIETLDAEHRLIEHVLNALERWATSNEGDDRPELGRFVRFLRELVDDIHHEKEEGILFERMVAHGFPHDQGPIAVMLHEHHEGRELIADLARFAGRAEPWGETERRTIRAAARAYGDLLRPHIYKEDQILYPMAQAHLPPEGMEEVERRCAIVDATPLRNELIELGRALVARHGG